MLYKQFSITAEITYDHAGGVHVEVKTDGLRVAEVVLRRDYIAACWLWRVTYCAGARTWGIHELGANLAVLSMVSEVGRSLVNEAAKLNATGAKERSAGSILW